MKWSWYKLKKLSLAAQNLWAKKSYNMGDLLWLPLCIHMKDSASIAEKLWNQWLSQGTINIIAKGVGGELEAEQLFLFLSAAHDIGKGTPVFQAKKSRPPHHELDNQIEEKHKAAGLPIRKQQDFVNSNKTPHALASQVLLESEGCNRNVAAILGAHHGKPPETSIPDVYTINAYGFNYHLEKEGKIKWRSIQKELISYALELAGLPSVEMIPTPNMVAQVLLSGLLIMSDWIASNESYFPYIRLDDLTGNVDFSVREKNAWSELALTCPWIASAVFDSGELFSQRFSFEKPNTLQLAAAEIALDIMQPGILVIEAPMGKGKTEAALACAEVFAGKTKRNGVFFALPTQATSDGIFPRLCNWIEKLDDEGLYSIKLAHGKAQFNQDYQFIANMEGSTNIGFDEESSLVVHEWFEGKKKSLLADFVVGTIDQLLLAALKQKHVMLRHLGLAQKVVIIDECHAYDAYMGQYLRRALNWLGAYGTPVIVLSATLPASKRQAVIGSYLNKSAIESHPVDLFGNPSNVAPPTQDWVESLDYPLITYTKGNEIMQRKIVTKEDSKKIHIEFLSEEKVDILLEGLLSQGGCVGIIVNTVKRAQELARLLRIKFSEETVLLLHSLFLAPDRIKNEKILLMELGKPGNQVKRPRKRIVVGTQVIEQSLDIDFDVIITDIAPIDLLLQRIGRLHRHDRKRPEKLTQAKCFIMGCNDEDFEEGAKHVYGEFLLTRTKALLQKTLNLPDDIPLLVQKTYEDNLLFFPETERYAQAKEKHEKLIAFKEERAQKFRLAPAWPGANQNLIGWLDADMSHQHGEAAVRDSDESIEVILVKEINEEAICFLSTEGNRCSFPTNVTPSNDLGKSIARQRIRLPSILCAPWAIDKTIKELEQINMERLSEWQQSSWLKGDLALILDQNNSVVLNGFRLTYCADDGLIYEKEVTTDA